MWTVEAEAQVTPLFENADDKLAEFKAFVEAGPSTQPKDNRSFVTHVSIRPARLRMKDQLNKLTLPQPAPPPPQPIPDKALRGKFHQTLREAFSSKLVSAHKESEPAGEPPAIEVSWAQAAGNGRNRKRGGANARGERGEVEYSLTSFSTIR